MVALKKALNHGGTLRKSRDRSAAKRKHVQLATVDAETGRPSVRTVVFRGFLPRKFVGADADVGTRGEESCVMMFITDDRSAKYRHLGAELQSPQPIEACWWLDEAGVQFRIRGHALLATARSEDPTLRAAVHDVWDRLADGSRRTFFWPTPGAPKQAQAAEGTPAEEAPVGALEDSHFVLVLLLPDGVDELHLGGRQSRRMYELDGGGEPCTLARLCDARWSEVAVNP